MHGLMVPAFFTYIQKNGFFLLLEIYIFKEKKIIIFCLILWQFGKVWKKFAPAVFFRELVKPNVLQYNFIIKSIKKIQLYFAIFHK